MKYVKIKSKDALPQGAILFGKSGRVGVIDSVTSVGYDIQIDDMTLFFERHEFNYITEKEYNTIIVLENLG